MRPEKIAFFLPHFRHGGVERVVMLLLQHLDRQRFRPVLILQRQVGEYLERLDRDVEVIALRSPRPPFCVFELASILRRREIRLVYTATNATNIYSAFASMLPGASTRTIISEHTPLDYSLSEAKLLILRKAGIRLAYPRATLAVAPLAQICDELRSFLGPRCPPCQRLGNPVIAALSPPRALAGAARRIVSVGRLARVKRFDLLIEAFARFRGDAPDATLVVYGEGPERAALEAVAARLGVAGAVALPGYVDDVAARLESADIFVCSSQREGFGNAIIEAMAAGTPVVSVDCPFGPEILLRGGEAGRLVRDPDPNAMADAIREVARDLALRTRYADRGRKVASAFEVTGAARAYEEVFARVCA